MPKLKELTKNKKWIWVIAIIGIILFFQPGGIIKTQENVQAIIENLKDSGRGSSQSFLTPDKFMSVQLYDKNKNILKDGLFSIVQGIEGVQYISLSLRIRNTGNVPISCHIQSATPDQFYSSFNTKDIYLNTGEVKITQSNLIDITSFEGTLTSFTATVKCNSSKTILADKYGALIINVSKENPEQPGFEVDILPLEEEAKIMYLSNPEDPNNNPNIFLMPQMTKGFNIAFTVEKNYCSTPKIICISPFDVNVAYTSPTSNQKYLTGEIVSTSWVNDYLQVNPQFEISTYGTSPMGSAVLYPETLLISDGVIIIHATVTSGSYLPANYQEGGLSCGISCNGVITRPFTKLYFNNAGGY